MSVFLERVLAGGGVFTAGELTAAHEAVESARRRLSEAEAVVRRPWGAGSHDLAPLVLSVHTVENRLALMVLHNALVRLDGMVGVR